MNFDEAGLVTVCPGLVFVAREVSKQGQGSEGRRDRLLRTNFALFPGLLSESRDDFADCFQGCHRVNVLNI